MYAKCRGKVQTVQFIRHAMTPPKRYDHLQTKIKRLETEYRQLIESTTPTTSAELSRIEEIEQLIPYVHAIKWEIVKQRLNQPINANQY